MSVNQDNQQEFELAEDFPLLVIPVYPAGDQAGLHWKNDPKEPFQRNAVIQRKGRVDIRCEHKDIIHGYLSEDSDDPYTLIILQFRFDPNGIAARIKEVHVSIKFAAMTASAADPEVVEIYPDGGFFVAPTTQREQIRHTAGIGIGAGAAGMEVRGLFQHDKTVERDRVDYAWLRGSIDVTRGFGRSDAVSWDFLENPRAKSGVVSSMQGAILLWRENMEPFTARVTLNATMDTRTRIDTLFTKDPKEDDVWYDPNKPPTNRLHKYDVDNLGALDINALCDVTFRTILENTTKTKV
ncbi:hypothetical protein CNMCM5793_006495 [Aspergillus hiratsukae]|uniref:Uncharacterized protein n=1 Tax=Aspergillus hiratsukae TaxID=1194566 RepID=A0A8H6QGA0_9EURO|nr:hypothetical protein CNMCM5793_006495 [Aspergillus hiratsukae]KAF7173296.1 hypothetical protein CNMCM6106_007411 [Aspergillus hiratsukae]